MKNDQKREKQKNKNKRLVENIQNGEYTEAMKIQGRDEIINTATEIIAFSGIDKLTMQSLGEEMGINKASIYHWFKSKEEILDEVFSYGHKKLMSKGFRLDLEGSSEKVLTRAADAWTRIFSDEELLPYLRTVFSLCYADDRAAEEAADLTASLIAAPFKFTKRVLDNLFWWV